MSHQCFLEVVQHRAALQTPGLYHRQQTLHEPTTRFTLAAKRLLPPHARTSTTTPPPPTARGTSPPSWRSHVEIDAVCTVAKDSRARPRCTDEVAGQEVVVGTCSVDLDSIQTIPRDDIPLLGTKTKPAHSVPGARIDVYAVLSISDGGGCSVCS
jgi:hypothetical protein